MDEEETARDGQEVDHDERAEEGREDQHDEVETGEIPRCAPCPGAPSKAERLAHEVTHWPYRPWCEWCARGRAVGPNAKSLTAEQKVAFVPKAHLDYAFLRDEVVEVDDRNGQEEGVAMTMTMLVMVETLCDSVWCYATNGKGHASDPWLAKKLQQDLATVGVGATRIVVKTDTEAAIVELRREVAKSRGEAPTGSTIPE